MVEVFGAEKIFGEVGVIDGGSRTGRGGNRGAL